MGDDAPSGDSLPHGIVTFLFTDIEGSTRRWEVHGNEMAACVARHESLLAGVVDAAGGLVVKSTGDGVMAVFTNADDALHAALGGQLAIESQDWSPIPGIGVRMGLHTGWCETTDNDYFGAVVERAARIADAGHGAQILLSAATHAVLERSTDIEIVSRGNIRLKDLSEPVEVYQVLAGCLNNELLRLRVVATDVDDLPIQPTVFVGGDTELELTARTLEVHRLVTLLGPGGVGKTRLATQTAGEVSQQFEAGVRFVDLAEIDSSGAPAATTLDQLVRRHPNVSPSGPTDDPLEAIIRHLSGSEVLLILDNCEHVTRHASVMVDGILNHCPQVRVLATSREPLRIPAEHVVQVAPLTTSGGEPGRSPAVRLFVERAVAGGARPPDAASFPLIAEICQLVDGLPLGIELAAARSLHLPLEALRDRLSDQLHILQGREPTRPDRHRNTEALLRWSFDLLAPSEQLLLARLGVFAGPVDLDAIEAFCTDDRLPVEEVVDCLGALVDRSLVTYDGPTGRYRLLNIVRSFARDQFDAESLARWRTRHAEWCSASLFDATEAETGDALARFMASYGSDAAAALAWAITDARAELSWTLVGLTWRWYEMTGRAREGLELVQRALSVGPASETIAWASAATGGANLAMVVGDLHDAVDMHRRAIATLETCDAAAEAAWARVGLAVALMLLKDETATDVARSAVQVFEQVGDQRGLGHAWAALGLIAAGSGEQELAKQHYLTALSQSRLAGQRRDTASVLSNLGNLSQDRGKYREAVRFYDGALQLYREIGDRRGAGLILNNLCITTQRLGNPARAIEYSHEAIEEFHFVHDRQGEAAARHNLANLAIEAGDTAMALDLYAQAIEGFRDARDPRGVVMVLGVAAVAARREGREEIAWRYEIERTRLVFRLGLLEATRRALRSLARHATELTLDGLALRLAHAADSLLSDDVLRALEEAAHFTPTSLPAARSGRAISSSPQRLAELTPRERELLAEVGRGRTNSEIADSLFISRRTVDAHLSHIRTKLGVSDRPKLIVLAREHLGAR